MPGSSKGQWLGACPSISSNWAVNQAGELDIADIIGINHGLVPVSGTSIFMDTAATTKVVKAANRRKLQFHAAGIGGGTAHSQLAYIAAQPSRLPHSHRQGSTISYLNLTSPVASTLPTTNTSRLRTVVFWTILGTSFLAELSGIWPIEEFRRDDLLSSSGRAFAVSLGRTSLSFLLTLRSQQTVVNQHRGHRFCRVKCGKQDEGITKHMPAQRCDATRCRTTSHVRLRTIMRESSAAGHAVLAATSQLGPLTLSPSHPLTLLAGPPWTRRRHHYIACTTVGGLSEIYSCWRLPTADSPCAAPASISRAVDIANPAAHPSSPSLATAWKPLPRAPFPASRMGLRWFLHTALRRPAWPSTMPLALAFIIPSLDPTFFDWGVYGLYPTQQYSSFNLSGPQAKQIRWHDKCDQGHILLTPNGPSVARPGPMILDSRGDLIWMSDDFGATSNLKVQQYKGEDYLTLWSGDKAATSGKGLYFMLDSTYQVVRMITAVGDDLFGDLHEFKITPQGTGLLTVYTATKADLRGMGHGRAADGWIVDNLFQEIDIETGELLFQWRASDHFDPVETYMTNPFGGYWESIPFDFYHLNSVDKDSRGNYLISSRHFHHIVCVSPVGETLWILGGRDNQFQDLSNGKATDFKWQHDARWYSEEAGIITLFDNQKAGPLHKDASHSRVLFLQLDIPNKTAKLVHELSSLQGILASSQGSVQTLPDSDQQVFVGWGSAAAFSEYTAEGDLICETHLGASWFYRFERIKSYRTTKALNWHGTPIAPPQLVIDDDALYVSWNGATEVAFWSLEVSFEDRVVKSEDPRRVDEPPVKVSEESFESIDVISKVGFEGLFDLPNLPSAEKQSARYRVVALDKDHQVLRYSNTISQADVVSESSYLWILFQLCLVIGILCGIRIAFKWYRSGQSFRSYANSQRNYSAIPAWMDLASATDWKRTNFRSRSSLYEWAQLRWKAATFTPG
ncbi:hypothetical protein DOTSEDRAFT_36883 [Dothistroma septosporum NZE10]|uniref:ASST-domain-containing protein n=1 Tax=Dothistroma septosporum (strain NZE10 / CBS 128990) TaxID=675120 RepID=N1PH77_DOTSN|nr:hypothetical protein DOTSEDRAFT_36883 [Dothistroma septosporum NZE10]